MLAAGISGTCLYLLLPAVCIRSNRLLARSILRQPEAGQFAARENRLLPGRIKNWQKRKKALLLKAGFSKRRAWRIYLILQLGLPVLVFLLGLVNGGSVLGSLAGTCLLAVMVSRLLARRAEQRRDHYSQSLYKIYRFLDSQITAGISVTDALRGLPGAVRDPVVKTGLVQFAAIFEVTLDSEQAFAALEKIFDNSDCDLLAAHIRQCLTSGIAGKGLVRTEELLFSRAFAQMQAQTRAIRSSLTLIAAAALVLLLFIFVYPLLQGAFLALQTIFG